MIRYYLNLSVICITSKSNAYKHKVYKIRIALYNMPKKDEEDSVISETGNWNVADSYSKSKIMRPLILCDYYEDIATFGYDSIIEELVGYNKPSNDVIKIKAMKRLVKQLIRLIDNTKFALKKPNTRDLILEYRKDLFKLLGCIPNLTIVQYNQITDTQTIKIKSETLFNEILDKVSEIKSKINEPLNKNHLIFTDKEDFDPKAFKDKLKQRMVNQG